MSRKTDDDDEYVETMEEDDDDEIDGDYDEDEEEKTASRSKKQKKIHKQQSKQTKNISTRRLKKYIKISGGKNNSNKKKKFEVDINVALTGARGGDILHGYEDDSANVVLQINSGGIVYAPSGIRNTVEDEVGYDNVVSSFAKYFGISTANAKLRYDDCPVKDVPNHCPLGQGCSHKTVISEPGGKQENNDESSSKNNVCNCQPTATFSILNQGVWQKFASAHGNGDQLEEIVHEKRSVSYRDVLQLMHTIGQPGGKLLILRPKLFKVVAGPLEVKMDDVRMSDPNSKVIDAACGLDLYNKTTRDASSVAATIATSCYEMDGSIVKLPSSAPSTVIDMNNTSEIIINSLSGLVDEKDINPTQIKYCLKVLASLSAGGLKSCLQKTIRFFAKEVELPLLESIECGDLLDVGEMQSATSGSCICVPSTVVVAICIALLFSGKGTFSPELQLFTRGCTSALKRTAIILIEDSWVSGASEAVLSLTALAWASQRIPGYEPPLCVIMATIRLAVQACLSPYLIMWRANDTKHNNAELNPVPKKGDQQIDDKDTKALGNAAKILRIVRSFEGDMVMFEKVAKIASRHGRLPLSKAKSRERLALMPLCHIVDQHTYRGIAHIGPKMCGNRHTTDSFKSRFDIIFQSTTGFNPRQFSPVGFESKEIVQNVRFAQQCCLHFALRIPRQKMPSATAAAAASGKQAAKEEGTEGEVGIKLELDSGVLAAGVGPIPVKVRVGGGGGVKGTKKKGKGRQIEVLVLLGVEVPEDEVVMIKPARAARDLWGTLSDEERTTAIAIARSQTYKARSPLLVHEGQSVGGKKNIVSYCKTSGWQIDGKPWSEVVQQGQTLHVPLVEPPRWAVSSSSSSSLDEFRQLLQNSAQGNRALQDALRFVGDGLIPNAERWIRELTAMADTAVVLRAVSLLRQQYKSIAMPTPALFGGISGDQLLAYAGDWDVYRLLVLVSRLAPGALRPTMPPNFDVPYANLLRLVEKWMMGGLRGCGSFAGAMSDSGCHDSGCGSSDGDCSRMWAIHPKWTKSMCQAEEKMMEHQRAALLSMHKRDDRADTGHFLIMDTGLGKTLTSLCYMYRWLKYQERRRRTPSSKIQYILWVTPAGTVDNLIEQLQTTWSVPIWKVPRISTAKNPKPGDSTKLVLKSFTVNVIHADHLRTAIDKGLAEMAPSSVIVFDEVDEMYAPTLRTSAARRLAQLCAKFVAQTATPMRKNEAQLRAWLADTCSFPVDSRNLLVAASGMVSIQLELGIKSIEKLVQTPMLDIVRNGCRTLLQSRSWLEMAKLVQSHSDPAMVETAVQLAIEDCASHGPAGGVLLVANDLKHAEKLIRMCSSIAKGKFRVGDFDSLEASNDANIVVVTKDKDRGYNSACRLGVMVTGAYAGNGASRHQIRGRLRRLGQKRTSVKFVTVVMEHSILQLLHERHNAVDTMNISLEQLGQKFLSDVLNGLGQQSDATTYLPAAAGKGPSTSKLRAKKAKRPRSDEEVGETWEKRFDKKADKRT